MDLDLPLHVGRPLASVLCPDRRELKKRLFRWLWLTQAGGREGYRMRDEPVVAEAGMTLQQHEARCVFSQGSFPWIMGPWQWWAAQPLGRGGGIVTCVCTQASWWLQQQP